MKNLAVTLWMFQLIAALVMLVAAAIKTESILITGPALSLIGLLLGLATCALQSPAALAFALSAPLVCGLILFLIAAFRWGAREAYLPTVLVLSTYMLLMAPFAIVSGDRLWRWKTVTGKPPRGFQFGLRTLLIAITACCLLIPIVTYLLKNMRGESFVFRGFTILVVTLSGLVVWRYRACAGRSTAAREAPGPAVSPQPGMEQKETEETESR